MASWLARLHTTVPVARRVLREMVGHLIVDASEEKLGDAIAELTKTGNRLNVNLLGEAVLGDKEAEHRLAETKRLLARDDVDYVSIKVSAVSYHQHWAFDEVVETAVRRLTPCTSWLHPPPQEVHQPGHGGVQGSGPHH